MTKKKVATRKPAQQSTPLYVRLPDTQMKWIRLEADAQSRTVRSVMNRMVDAAQRGLVFVSEQ